MKFKDIALKLQSTKKQGLRIDSTSWPSDFYFDSKELDQFKSIESYTNKESMFFKKTQGAVGWEYALNIFLLIDELYFSKPIAGNYSSVNSGVSARVNPIYQDNNKKVYFDIEIGERKIKSRLYETEAIRDKFSFSLVAIMHTHPKFYHDKNTFQYTFFSPADLTALLRSQVNIIGMIAGKSIWLACKTEISNMIPTEHLTALSQLEVRDGVDAMKKYIKENLNEYGIIFYQGSFGGKMVKIN